MTKIICIDFDGVIHSYKSGWKGADQIPDKPVEGAMCWLMALLSQSDIEVAIYSSRSCQENGIEAMQNWLAYYGMEEEYIRLIKFPKEKPPAFLTIDDRAICFRGTFPAIDEIRTFKSWIEK